VRAALARRRFPWPPGQRLKASRVMTLVALLGPIALLALLGWKRRWMAEDAFIYVRVVEHLVAGHGPVLNAGERVEAATSPLWVFILAAPRWAFHVPVEAVAVVGGLLLTLAGLASASLASLRLWRVDDGAWAVAPLGALVVLALPPMWDFATSGLETGLVFWWIGSSLLALTLTAAQPCSSQRRSVVAAFVFGLAPLVRPDLAVFGLVFLLVLVTARPCKRHAFGLVAAALALPAAYQLFRMGYYGSLVPNAALAKEASSPRWHQGVLYLTDLATTYWLVVPVVTALVLCLVLCIRHASGRGRRSIVLVALAPVVAALVHGLYIVRVGGDFMHARLLLPAVFALAAPVMVIAVRSGLQRMALAVTVAWALVCVTSLRVPYVVGPRGIVNERAFYVRSSWRPNPVKVDDYGQSVFYREGLLARDQADAGQPTLVVPVDGEPQMYALVPLARDAGVAAAFATDNVGIVGVVAGTRVHIVDIAGLGDAVASRIRLDRRGRPGHEKHLDIAWVLARFMDPGASPPSWVSPLAVDAARRALHCGELRELQEATESKLTPRRFFSNIFRAVQLHRFRFDGDPRTSEQVLCRGG
jgi:arabinofuranosyltransferase